MCHFLIFQCLFSVKGHGDFEAGVAKTRVTNFFQYINWPQKSIFYVILGAETDSEALFYLSGPFNGKKWEKLRFLRFSIKCLTRDYP